MALALQAPIRLDKLGRVRAHRETVRYPSILVLAHPQQDYDFNYSVMAYSQE